MSCYLRYFVRALCVRWLIVLLPYLRADHSGDVQLKLVIIHSFKIIRPERCMNQWHSDVTPAINRRRLVPKYRASQKSLCRNKEMLKCDWCQFLCATVLLLTWGEGGSILTAACCTVGVWSWCVVFQLHSCRTYSNWTHCLSGHELPLYSGLFLPRNNCKQLACVTVLCIVYFVSRVMNHTVLCIVHFVSRVMNHHHEVVIVVGKQAWRWGRSCASKELPCIEIGKLERKSRA